MISIEQIAAFCKRKGFVFPSSEIYGGMSGFFDFGPLGMELARNIKNSWWKSVVLDREIVEGIDGSIVSSNKVWEASGHVKNFVDLLVNCKKCKTRLRADHLIEDKLKIKTEGLGKKELTDLIKKNKIKCSCGGELEEVSEFNLMFETCVGAGNDKIFLRPETAQIIFINFKNVLETSRQKLPFGIAQIGKSFRNEISPRDFLFRMREFEQMELEFFADPAKVDECPDFGIVEKLKVNILTSKEQESKKPKIVNATIGDLHEKKILKTKWHAFWAGYRYKWFLDLGIKPDNLRLREHLKDELSHYSTSTFDIEYNYPFGWKELEGIADRTNFDLSQHIKFSGVDLSYFDPETKKRIVPNVAAEPSVGVERIFLTLLIDAYNEEDVKGEKRIVLKLHPKLAPYKAAVFPLVKRDGLSEKAKEIFKLLKDVFHTFYDESGSIGRRYRRMDEIGCPLCITIDYDTLKDESATVRYRDSMEQERVKVKDLIKFLKKKIEL